MDKDGSGHIDEFELANFLSVFAGYLNQPIPNQKQVKMLYKLLDADLDGKISYEEIREVLC
jgi:Ca2+-binding EF-hand superfamily protein